MQGKGCTVVLLQSRFVTWLFRYTVTYENVIISRSFSELGWKIILAVSHCVSWCLCKDLIEFKINIRE